MVQLSPLYQGRSQATINMPVRAEVPSGGSTEEDRLLFFFLIFIYLFIFGCIGSLLLHVGFL